MQCANECELPIIDLFAGPGGLGEGFSSLTKQDNSRFFKIKLSIEKDTFAQKTLELRAFFRQFPVGKAPKEYYEYMRGDISKELLFSKYKEESDKASNEAWLAELGDKSTPNSLVDMRIRRALNNSNNWVLIGGPPCQAYSLVGRSRMKGKNPEKFENDQRHFLYKEYLRIIAEHRPPVFVLENVKGLLSAEVHHEKIFEKIVEDLSFPSRAFSTNKENENSSKEYILYSLEPGNSDPSCKKIPMDYVVHSEKFGIPQSRHRVIILGVRSDISNKPTKLSERNKVNIEDVLNDLPKIRSGLSKENDDSLRWKEALQSVLDQDWFSLEKLPERIFTNIENIVSNVDPSLTRGSKFINGNPSPIKYAEWYSDPMLSGFCNHTSRAHIRSDLFRYLFSAVFAQINSRSPKISDFPAELLPNHKNISQALEGSKFEDRFRVQLEGRPSTTVVSHISKDGHYYIHYDPYQCRSLTVREAARLQTFPDNYCFEGPQTEQYKQVGNAVPPLLAKQIAELVVALFNNHD